MKIASKLSKNPRVFEPPPPPSVRLSKKSSLNPAIVSQSVNRAGLQPRLLIGRNLHQGRATWSGWKSGFPHSSLSSQGDRTSFRRSPCLSLYKPSDWVPIITKASLVESYCTVDIFEEGANIIEGISGGDNFTDGNEQEDCNPNEDPGVEA